MNEELAKIIELERKKKTREATMNDDDDIMFLQNYAVTNITQPEDCADVYDVILTPCTRPKVSLRIRKQDLLRLVCAMESSQGEWYLNLDVGALKTHGDVGVGGLISAEVDGEEGLHFYGICKEQDDDEREEM